MILRSGVNGHKKRWWRQSKSGRGCPSLVGGRPAKSVTQKVAWVQIPHPAPTNRETKLCVLKRFLAKLDDLLRLQFLTHSEGSIILILDLNQSD
jgi:hypothetical protein